MNEYGAAYQFMILKGREMGLLEKHKLTGSSKNKKE
jgi:hypothetical protein